MEREWVDFVARDLKRKMVFLTGPRQAGKTTLARRILDRMAPGVGVYLNWDNPGHRKTIRTLAWDRTPPVAVLDEVHKYGRWKNLLKGFHDVEGRRQKLLITGSARLDVYRRGGDSLLGRYFRHRLHPFSLGEAHRGGNPPSLRILLNPARWKDSAPVPEDLQSGLLRRGGFPEPFLQGSDRTVRRWRMARRDLVLRQDARDLTLIRDLSLLEQLADLLAARIGSPVSINSLREDLEVDHKTVSHWIDALERLYLVFRVRPFAGSLARTLRKESKIYFWDWPEATDEGARFENFVASHLLKFCHWLEDIEGIRADLRYVRDREKREIDFLILKESRPWVLIESKLQRHRDGRLDYFRRKLRVPHAYLVTADRSAFKDSIPAARLLASLP
ncbi:ATP-binding protein [bacterium]|nr:ATP-binding protein [bacterium]